RNEDSYDEDFRNEDFHDEDFHDEDFHDEDFHDEDFRNEDFRNEYMSHKKKDDFYLDLLDRLIWTEENSLIPFIMEQLDNLDRRFFEILDDKLKQATEESDERKNSLTYLNMVISNLNIRDKSKEKRLYGEKSLYQTAEDLMNLQRDIPVKHTVIDTKPPDSSLIIQFSEEQDIEGKEIEAQKAKKPVKLEFIDECLKKVIAVGATELHLTTGEKPNIRFWGELQPMDMPVLKEVLSDVLIAQMLSDEEKKEIEEHMHVDFMYNFADHDRKTRRFRGNAYYHRTGLNIIMKLMPDKIPSIKDLGLPEIVSAFGRFEQGLVLVTGGSGSGKTTTLHALLDLVNSERHAHIITIEDPIEFIHIPKKSIIRQRQIDLHTKSYLKALKASISEDPDVILISELRDPETIELAMVAAETGCLVLSSMNTLSCASTIERIIDSFPPEQSLQTGAMLSESLKAIVTQQLLTSRARSIRYPAVEILTGCTPLKSLIREQKIFQINSLIETNRSIGMQSMDSSILSLLKDKLITDEVAMEAATDKNNVKNFKASKSGSAIQEAISVLKKDRCAALGIITDPPVNNQGKIIKASLSPDYTLKDLFKVMVLEKASDLHITVGLPPKMRLKGEIAELYLPAVSEEKSWELLSGIFSKKQMEIFSREWDLDFTYEVSNIARFRCNMLREQNGVGAIFRIIPPEIPSMEILGLPEVLKKIACYRQGLVIITGPAGSGKTTTMACLLDYINSTRSANILTIEEPLEFIHKNKKSRIFHREIGIHAAGFREAVRAARKESVDIIMIGEMMEKDTIMEALLAADMGNLVLGIMHTTGVTRTVEKIIETFSGSMQGQIRSMLCNSLKAIVAQQLITTMDGTWRCAVIEVAINNQRLANVIRDGKTKMIDSVLHSSREEGMQSLDLALMQLVRDTKIDEETARLRSSNPRSFIIPKEFKPKW
ncbi:MAG: PilT/PilU family type 4a pilus ATPase, partial [Candidatus Eremiobacterota bacterium]